MQKGHLMSFLWIFTKFIRLFLWIFTKFIKLFLWIFTEGGNARRDEKPLDHDAGKEADERLSLFP
jgi:hypothetical protein